MAVHTLASTVSTMPASEREAIITVTGSTSYDTGGSVLDLSTLTGATAIRGLVQVNVTPVGSAKYLTAYLAAAAGAPGTGKVVVYDVTQHPGAEVVATTALNGTTWTFKVLYA